MYLHSLRRWMLPLGVALAVLAISCQSDDLVRPDRAPPSQTHVPPPPDVSGSHSIEVPATNTNNFGHVGWHSAGITVPEPMWILVRVTGSITLGPNPEYTNNYCPDGVSPTECVQKAGQVVGPLGDEWGDLRVGVRVRSSGGTIGVELHPVETEPYTVEGIVRVPAGPAEIEAQRVGIAGGGSCYDPPSRWDPPGTPGGCPGGTREHHAGYYTLSGSQTVHVEGIQPVQVHARRTRVTPGDTVVFDATVAGSDVSTIRWLYEPGDTAATPKWDYGRIWHDIPACRDQRTCEYVPPASGRMYVVARVHRVYVRGVSQIVRVAEDSLVVGLVVNPERVPPVLDRNFNAEAQTWSDAATSHRLYDLVDLDVSARWEPSGRPASGADLRFTVEPEDRSGGHLHAPRPKGAFFRIEERPTRGDQKKGVLRPELTLRASEDGTAEAVYRSSGVSGVEVLRVEATAEGQTVEDKATVAVRLPERALEAVDRAGDSYVFEGSRNSHYNVENYLAPGVIEHMDAIWADYLDRHRAQPADYPLDINRFTVTGASVKWGGLYDIGKNWTNPHNTHRTGRDIDFDAGALESEANRQALVDLCARYAFEGVRTTCQVHGEDNHFHFHAFIGRTFYHR